MNKQEILEEINKTKEHLANMKKMLEECECERWKPQKGETYFELNRYGVPTPNEWNDTYYDNIMFNLYNVFQTYKLAKAEAEKILVRRMLEDIAERLNKGREIDWNNFNQIKYFIYIDYATQLIRRDCDFRNKIQGVVYCLSDNFVSVAKREIGEERLKKYLRGE